MEVMVLLPGRHMIATRTALMQAHRQDYTDAAQGTAG